MTALERYRIPTYADGTEVQEGDSIRYRQAPGGILPASPEWKYGTAQKFPRTEEECARITAYNVQPHHRASGDRSMSAPTPAALMQAARASVQIKPAPQTGIRPNDPLMSLIPDDAELRPLEFADLVTKADAIVGHEIPLYGPGNIPARIRSELRRWAMRDDAARIAAEQDWADAIAAVDEADAAVVAARRALESAEAAQRAAMKRADEIANPEGVR